MSFMTYGVPEGGKGNYDKGLQRCNDCCLFGRLSYRKPPGWVPGRLAVLPEDLLQLFKLPDKGFQ